MKKARPEAGDPLARAAGMPARPVPGSFHYTFRIRSFDGAPLATSYYPSKLGSRPRRSCSFTRWVGRRDFEDPVLELKGLGLAEHLKGWATPF